MFNIVKLSRLDNKANNINGQQLWGITPKIKWIGGCRIRRWKQIRLG